MLSRYKTPGTFSHTGQSCFGWESTNQDHINRDLNKDFVLFTVDRVLEVPPEDFSFYLIFSAFESLDNVMSCTFKILTVVF